MQPNSLLERLAARRRYGMRPGLATMRALLDALGNPQDSLKVVHVAGTNGKGAVTAMLDAVLRAAGYRVCRYTSPHLVSLAERFFVDGAPASAEALATAEWRDPAGLEVPAGGFLQIRVELGATNALSSPRVTCVRVAAVR